MWSRLKEKILWACLGGLVIIGFPLAYCISYEDLAAINFMGIGDRDPFGKLVIGMTDAEVLGCVGEPSARSLVRARSENGSSSHNDPEELVPVWVYRRRCAKSVAVVFSSNRRVKEIRPMEPAIVMRIK